MDGHVNVGGVWKRLTGLHVNVGGVWKEVQNGFINVSGVWKQFYRIAAPVLTALTDPLASLLGDPASNQPQVSVRFKSNGDIEEATGDTGSPLSYSKVGEWLNNTTGMDGSEWELNFTVDSETGAAGTWTGATRGSYIDLSIDRTFTWTKDTTAIGQANSEVTATVREIAEPTNSASRSALTYRAEVVV